MLSIADSHIYISGELLVDNLNSFSSSLRTTKAALCAESALNSTKKQPIFLHLSSYGGDLFAGYGMADLIESLDYPVIAVAEGVVASAASLVFIACKKRLVLPHSQFMVHEFNTMYFGTHSDFLNEINAQKTVMKQFIKFYVKRTNLTKNELVKRLKKDWWFTAKQAIKWGFADDYF